MKIDKNGVYSASPSLYLNDIFYSVPLGRARNIKIDFKHGSLVHFYLCFPVRIVHLPVPLTIPLFNFPSRDPPVRIFSSITSSIHSFS